MNTRFALVSRQPSGSSARCSSANLANSVLSQCRVRTRLPQHLAVPSASSVSPNLTARNASATSSPKAVAAPFRAARPSRGTIVAQASTQLQAQTLISKSASGSPKAVPTHCSSFQIFELEQHAANTLTSKRPYLQVWKEGFAGLSQRLTAALDLHPEPTKLSAEGLLTHETPSRNVYCATQVGTGRSVQWAHFTRTTLAHIDITVMRLNIFPDASTRAPKLDIEFFYGFGFTNMYINLVPRTNLISDPEYVTKYYRQPGWGGSDKSLFDLKLECEADPAFKPFLSRSLDMRILAGQVAMFHTAEGSEENARKIVGIASQAVDMWLAMMTDQEGRQGLTQEESVMLSQQDKHLLNWARLDPDIKKASTVMGEEMTERMLQMYTKDPSILLDAKS